MKSFLKRNRPLIQDASLFLTIFWSIDAGQWLESNGYSALSLMVWLPLGGIIALALTERRDLLNMKEMIGDVIKTQHAKHHLHKELDKMGL